jgi:hypothetical protein
MTAIVFGIIGFYFGNRGAERAEEQVREVVNQLARGGPGAIQAERIESQLREIREKMEMAIEQAQKAVDLVQDAYNLHRDDLKKDANKYFLISDQSIEECYKGMKAWIYADHAWLKLDQDKPPYGDILDMFTQSQKLHEETWLPSGSGLFSKYNYIGKAIAQIWLGHNEDAIKSLNSIGKHIAELDDLYKTNDLKERDVKKFTESSIFSRLNPEVKEYLEEAKSSHEKKKETS